jgi:Ca2+-binding EF-hand superfamily protein
LQQQGISNIANISTFDGVNNEDENLPTKVITKSSRRYANHLRSSLPTGILPGAMFSDPSIPINKSNAPKKTTADVGAIVLIQKFKNELSNRGGNSYIGLQRKFRIVDDDNNKIINLLEFKKSMKEMNISMNDTELRMLFDYFDADRSGNIDFEEFIQGVRDPLTERRLSLVKQAYSKLDKDGNGLVDASEIASLYDASKHPEVIAGRKTANQVYTEFLDTFDVGGVHDGKVTLQEFVNYYTNIGANIDNEDYFELMIRNAWHISGGEGVASNTANRRVLVTKSDGSQSIEEIKNGDVKNDKNNYLLNVNEVASKLKRQHLSSHITLFGNNTNNKNNSEEEVLEERFSVTRRKSFQKPESTAKKLINDDENAYKVQYVNSSKNNVSNKVFFCLLICLFNFMLSY